MINYDHAVKFLVRHKHELEQSAARGPLQAKILVVYHGTDKKNFGKIIDSNLKVPGKSVLSPYLPRLLPEVLMGCFVPLRP